MADKVHQLSVSLVQDHRYGPWRVDTSLRRSAFLHGCLVGSLLEVLTDTDYVIGEELSESLCAPAACKFGNDPQWQTVEACAASS